jgi:endonuclease IV
MQWFGNRTRRTTFALYEKEFATRKFSAVFGHAGYLINLGAQPEGPNRDNSLKSLIQEIHLATQIGIPFSRDASGRTSRQRLKINA